MIVRVYLPLSVSDLSLLHAAGSLPAGRLAHAVTDDDRRSDPQADEEELEYDALSAAADAAYADRRGAGCRVVVAAADVSTTPPADSPFLLDRPVGTPDLVSFHVSEAGAAEDEELLWYDVSELAPLLAELENAPTT